MRIFSFIVLIVFAINVHGQSRDLFITYDDEALLNKLVAKNDSKTLETYLIGFEGKENPQYKFYLDKNGNLKQDIRMLGDSGGSLTFVYEKHKKQNNDIKVTFNKMQNVIRCNQIVYSKGTDFEGLFSNFDNIYLVDVTNKKGSYKAKKIKVIVNTSL